MSDGPVIAVRLLQYASTLVLFGSTVFALGERSRFEPGATATLVPPVSLQRLQQLAVGLALAASLAWIMAEAAAMSGDPRAALSGPVLWSLVSQTRIGRVQALRVLLLAATAATAWGTGAARARPVLQASLAGAVVASFAWSGHGGIDAGVRGALHLASDVLHLLAAALWLGALVVLSLALRQASRKVSLEESGRLLGALERFSGIGYALVALLVLSGIANVWFLSGAAGWRLLSSPYGATLGVKLALFALMLGCAANNRFRLVPRLRAHLTSSAAPPLAELTRSVVTESVLGLAVLAAVAVLGTLEPPAPIP